MDPLLSDLKAIQAPSTPPAVIDVDAANFVSEVMDASLTRIVLINFWSPRSDPRDNMAPILEKAVAPTKGAAKLVQINVDKCPQIAQQMRIESVPTVFAFFNKKLIDGFAGVQPDSQIKIWLAELIKTTGAKPQADNGEGLTTALKQAADLLLAGDIATAHSIYADILAENRSNIEAFAGLLKCLIAMGDHASALDILSKAPAEMADHKALTSVRTSLELTAQAQNTVTSVEALEAKLKANENDHQARFDLALALYGAGKTSETIACLLEIVRRDRKWNDEAARKQLVKLFEALGGDHPQTIDARKQLSILLFS